MMLAAVAKDRRLGLCLNDIGPEIHRPGLERIFDYVGRNPSARTLAEIADVLGGIDVLFVNAGVGGFAMVPDVTPEFWDQVHSVNLRGAFFAIQKALPLMRDGGAIVITGSIGSVAAVPGNAAYAAAKGGIISITRSVAIHCQEQDYGIRCNAIAPGGIATPMMDQAMSAIDLDDPGMAQNKNFGLGHPSDIANAVLYLASDESRFMTGAMMVIDNGETIR